MKPNVNSHYDRVTGTITYIVYDTPGGHATIIDPVLDYDPKSGRTSTLAADAVIKDVRELSLSVDWILETHAHADHLSAAQYLKSQVGGKIAIGDHIGNVQGVFKKIFNLESSFSVDGSQFDKLLADEETFSVGALTGKTLFVPGHTPACVAYQFGDTVFVGDTLFMPDVGSARCDFPGGDAHQLYQSVRKLLSLAPETRLLMCHDYPPAGRAPQWETTVAEQRQHNIHLHDGISESDFVRMRTTRDAGLEMPILILPSVQLNIRAGSKPPVESNGISYLKTPLDTL